MQTLETDIEIGVDGSLKLLSPLPSWMKPGRVHVIMTSMPEETAAPMAGIEKTPGVNGGDACITGTRIPVWVLMEMRRQGATEAEILEDFPGLTRAQLAQAAAYVEQHREEIEAALTAHVEA